MMPFHVHEGWLRTPGSLDSSKEIPNAKWIYKFTPSPLNYFELYPVSDLFDGVVYKTWMPLRIAIWIKNPNT